MKRNKLIITIGLATAMLGSIALQPMTVYADQFNVVSIGANLTQKQKDDMLKYFNVKKGQYEEVTINNQEEHQELKGIVPDAQIGTKTISCAYVQPTTEGGINVKTANLTYVTATMIQNALVTAGINNANVIASAPFAVSGTGALTGIMKSYEKATGEKISPEKKELANKEMKVTSDVANNKNVGQDKAAAVVNDVKKDVIKNKETQPQQIADTINNVTNNYGVDMTQQQKDELNKLMQDVAKQGYNYDNMKATLNGIQEQLNKSLANQGELKGFMNNLGVKIDNLTNWFKEKFSKEDNSNNIVNETNNNALGSNTVVTGSSDKVQQITDKVNQESKGFIAWIKSLFGADDKKDNQQNQQQNQQGTEAQQLPDVQNNNQQEGQAK